MPASWLAWRTFTLAWLTCSDDRMLLRRATDSVGAKCRVTMRDAGTGCEVQIGLAYAPHTPQSQTRFRMLAPVTWPL